MPYIAVSPQPNSLLYITMEGKKISFGFTKTKKAEKPVVTEKREYIDCVEEKSIKVVGGEEAQDESPLVIPLKPNTLITPGRLKQIEQEVESAVQETPVPVTAETQVEEKPQDNESLDQMAVRELLEEAKKVVKVKTGPELAISVPALPVIDGKKESTLDDYDNVPVQDFGLAMLRGMGWTPGAEKSKYKEPQLRPKGLGLGADKVINKPQSKARNDRNEEELMIVKNAFVKITTGKYSGCYGKVLSLDEDNGRVMVDIAVRKETVSLSEFMMQPVTKSEFDKQSRVINADKYEEYKRKETEPSSSSSKRQSERQNPSNSTENRTEKPRERSRDRDRHANGHKSKIDKHRKSRSSSNDKEYRKERKKYSSNESLSSESDGDRRRKHKHNKRRQKSPDTDSSDSHKKYKNKDKIREIDKKRKGKKKKRDRDRSPNYKKYRK